MPQISTRSVPLASALLGSLALYASPLKAQDYDTWTLDREVLNAAANYTNVLTTAHREVRKYITWNWNTSLTEDQQRTRTEAVLREITSRQQVVQYLVPSLDMDVVNDFDVRFRWCAGKLLSYFASGFKHGLSAQQIVDAPDLRARRAGRTFTGEPLGLVEGVGDELMLRTFGGRRSTPIPTCMGTDYGGALAEGTVAYMTSAAQKFGVARTRRQREVRKLPCDAPQVGPGIKQQRYLSTNYNAQGDQLGDPFYDTDSPEGGGHWRTKYSHCRSPATISVRRIQECEAGSDRVATYRYFLTEAYDPDFADTGVPAGTEDFAKYVWRPSDRTGTFADAPDGELVRHLSFCGDASPPPSLEPVITRRTETRAGVCRAPYRRGTLTQAREVEIRRWSFADSPDVIDFPALREVVTEIEGSWTVSDDRCYRNVDERTTESKVSSCPSDQTGSVSYQRIKTVTGVDWRSAAWLDRLTTSHTRWTVASNNCKRKPRGGGGNSRGGGGDGNTGESVDVDGDGRGDFSDSVAASYAGYGSSQDVPGPCGACNGPQGKGPSSGGKSGGNWGGGGSSGGGGSGYGGGGYGGGGDRR